MEGVLGGTVDVIQRKPIVCTMPYYQDDQAGLVLFFSSTSLLSHIYFTLKRLSCRATTATFVYTLLGRWVECLMWFCAVLLPVILLLCCIPSVCCLIPCRPLLRSAINLVSCYM
ncbi:hypothetical protein I7I53_03311 [Histoplasma capsulatum var. duboisii H88]|uniref:Uncharacterized protein n=1 Tax=Ajellomyces capsulatus (strain H88) TaxID=544711 RepID=A0A8A1LTN9_AJEC8|nr:hypothetical protein I7I53_03311 [Histoplasma capsulatum var. duboisii H88]